MTQQELEATFNQSAPQEQVTEEVQTAPQQDLASMFEQSIPEADMTEHQETMQEIIKGIRGELPEPQSYEEIETYGLEFPERDLSDVLTGSGGTPAELQNKIYRQMLEEQTQDMPLEEQSDLVFDVTPLGKAAGAVAAIGATGAAYKTGKLLKRARYRNMPLGKLTSKAATKDKVAIKELAKRAGADKTAMEAADRLEIDLPADVWATGEKGIEIQKTAGLARSQIGEEEAIFANTIRKAAKSADRTMDELSRAESVATISDDVLQKLKATRDDLGEEASKIYKNVKGQIPPSSLVNMPNSRAVIEKTLQELGDNVNLLSTQEKKLLNLLSQDNLTYAALERERRLIGQATGKAMKSGPYKDADSSLLGQLYGAIKEDQLGNVERLAGTNTRDLLKNADRLFGKKKALEDSITSTFGKETAGSIADLMTRSINLGVKGNISAMNKLLDAVPQDMHKEVMSTALADMVKGTENIPFDFAKFTKVYKGLRDNPPIYNKFIGAVGKDKHQLLGDLYKVSKAVTEARGNLIKTGRAMQPVLESLQAEGLITKAIRFALEKVPKKFGIDVKLDGLLMTPKDRIEAVSKMFRSPAFKDMVADAAVKVDGPSSKTIDNFMKSPAFVKVAKQRGMTPRQAVDEFTKPAYPKVPEEFRKETIAPTVETTTTPDFRQVPEFPPSTEVIKPQEEVLKQ
jgi:hypothetical protein